jgi:hypothetical protein
MSTSNEDWSQQASFRQCWNCCYGERLTAGPKGPEGVLCRRFPPTVAFIGFEFEQRWPIMLKDMWCGEFRP